MKIKKRNPVGKKKKEITWTFEDAKKEHLFDGKLEAGQNSSYVLFSMDQSNEFRVYPLGQWYNFKHRTQYATLTLEQAEEQLHSRKSKVDRWMMKKFMKDDDIKSEIKEEPKIIESEDAPSRSEEKRSVKIADDEEQPELEDVDDTDFQSKFDDDDEDDAPEEPEDKEVDDDQEEQNLTASGKELKTLLKNASKEEEFHVSSDEEEEEEETTNDAEKKPEISPPAEQLQNIESLVESIKKRPATDDLNDSERKKVKVKSEELDEEEVRNALLVLGKAKTKTLVNKFKTQLTNEAQKGRFAKILKKLARIVEEHGEKYFVLKDEYRGGLKGPK